MEGKSNGGTKTTRSLSEARGIEKGTGRQEKVSSIDVEGKDGKGGDEPRGFREEM